MELDNLSFQDAFTHQIATRDAFTHQICNFYLKEYKRCAPDTIIFKTRSEVKVKVTVTKMELDNLSFQDAFTHQIATRDAFTHQICNFYLKEYKRCAPDTILFKTRSEVKVKVIVTRKWYVALRHPRMHLHTKFGIPTSKNIGNMHQTQSSFSKIDQRLRSMSQGPKDGARRFVISRCIQIPNLGFLQIPNLGFLP